MPAVMALVESRFVNDTLYFPVGTEIVNWLAVEAVIASVWVKVATVS
jgi:hypothetical protein